MAPEQALAGSESGGAPSVRWDLYGLGATFYWLLSGTYPYIGREQLAGLAKLALADRLTVYREILHSSPLRRLTQVDSDLADILEGCLRLDPEKRTSSVSDVLEDLRRREKGEPLLCRRPWPLSYRAVRFFRRPAVLVASISLLALLGGGVYAYAELRSVYEQQQAAAERERQTMVNLLRQRGAERYAQGEDEEAALWWASALVKQPEDAGLRRRLGGRAFALARLDEDSPYIWNPRKDQVVQARGDHFLVHDLALRSSRKVQLPERSMETWNAFFHPDGRHLAVGCHVGDRQCYALIYDLQLPQRPPIQIDLGDRLDYTLGAELAWASDDTLRSLSDTDEIAFWSWREGRLLRRRRIKTSWRPQRAAMQAKLLGAGELWIGENVTPKIKRVSVVEVDSGKLLLDVPGFVDDVELSPDGRLLRVRESVYRLPSSSKVDIEPGMKFLCFGSRGEIGLVSGGTVKVGKKRYVHETPVDTGSISPDGRFVLTFTRAPHRLYLWDLASESLLTCKNAAGYGGFSPSGEFFFSLGTPPRIWRLDPPGPTWEVSGSDALLKLLWGGDGRWLAAFGPERLVAMDVQGRKLLEVDAPIATSVASALSPSGLAATLGKDHVSLWSQLPHAAKEQRLPLILPSWPNDQCLAFNPQGTQLVCGSDIGVSVWDIVDGKALEPRSLLLPGSKIVAFSPDGRYLAALAQHKNGADWHLYLWEAGALKPTRLASPMQALRPAGGGQPCLAFSPDGNFVFTGSGEVCVVRRMPSGEQVGAWEESGGFMELGGSFELIAQASVSGQTIIRRLPAGELLYPGLSYPRPVPSHQPLPRPHVSPDGSLMLLTEWNMATLWDLRYGEPLPFLLPTPGILDATFAQDGRAVFVCTQEGSVQRWDIPQAQAEAEEVERRWQRYQARRLEKERGLVNMMSPEEWGRH